MSPFAPQDRLGESLIVYPIRRLALIAGLMLVTAPAWAQGEPKAMPVSVSEPIAKRVTQWDEYSGRFDAVATVEVRARVSGFIEKLHFTNRSVS